MNTTKKCKTMNGNLMRPVTVGNAAVFSSDGLIYRTSVVIALHKQTKNYIHFETQNTHYHLSMQPFPHAAISPLPVRMAACA